MKLSAFLALAASFSSALAHSWVEQLNVIDDNGTFVGAPGYPRGYVPRTKPGFGDALMVHLLPAASRSKIDGTDTLCMPSQQQPGTNTPDFPSLRATAGSYIALKYLENGHVSMPQNPPGKPEGSGKVHIYVTTSPSPDTKLVDVLKWTSTGSFATGRLLTTQDFDDGRCYQLAPSAKSVQRQKDFPDPIPGQTGPHEQWCETDVQLPADTPSGSLAMYWVWEWPTIGAGAKDETYTTCMDVVVGDANAVKAATPGKEITPQDPQTKAVPSFKQRAAGTDAAAPPAASGAASGAAPPAAAPTTMVTKPAPAPPAGTPPAAPPAAPNAPGAPAPPAGGAARATVTVTQMVTVTAGCYGGGRTGTPLGPVPRPTGADAGPRRYSEFRA
ncbi:hypothetical protein EJ06DRAFT_192428 [Trichodelitschia bisporula]|uniref:DUF7492 domain-containing protein n=1 Tax=Trichodelitschia bisporula TaxID=703511 RepID=A0A6G1I7R6_9PEZI|nr:hypothetical protein EJ06DRAFT_192428 [Trichodelitschia bisporula]